MPQIMIIISPINNKNRNYNCNINVIFKATGKIVYFITTSNIDKIWSDLKKVSGIKLARFRTHTSCLGKIHERYMKDTFVEFLSIYTV